MAGVEALELRIAGKAVWFEPIEDDDDEEEELVEHRFLIFSSIFLLFCCCLLKVLKQPARRQQLEGEGPWKAMRHQIYRKAMDPPVRQLLQHLKVHQDHSGP